MITKKIELRLSIIFLMGAISFYIWANNQRMGELEFRVDQLENVEVIR